MGFISRKLYFVPFLLLLSLFSTQAQARHSGEDDPVSGGGPFGIGVEAGYPGNWGVVGKLWLSYRDALQPDIKFTDGASILQLDYLWHNYHLFHVRSGAMPIYIGLGGDLSLTNPAVFGVRVPFGLSYIFGHGTPLDIYAQVVPTLWLTNPDSSFDLYGNVGIRVYP